MNDLAVIQYNVTDAAISQMEAQYLPLKINGIEDKVGFMAVHEARMVVKSHRVAVEKKRKELNSDALAWQRKVNEEAKRITAKLEPIEAHLDAQETVVLEEKARIKAEAERKELARVTGIREKIAEIRSTLIDIQGEDSSDIGIVIDRLFAFPISEEEYQEFYQEAIKARTDTIEALARAKASREKWEQEQAAAKDEAERLEKERAAQEEREKALVAVQKRMEAEGNRIKAEREALEKAKKEEKERQERAELEARLRLEAKARAEAELQEKAEREAKEKARQEALKPDKEKIVNYIGNVLFLCLPDLADKTAEAVLTDAYDSLNRWAKKFTKQAEAL